MSSPHEFPVRSGDGGAALEDYLDHLGAPLVDVMPYAERQAVRQEIGDHLRALAAAGEELGTASPEALAQALRRFGPPRAIGNAIRRERLAPLRTGGRFLAAAAAAGTLTAVSVSSVLTLLTGSHLPWLFTSPGWWALVFLANQLIPALLGGVVGLLVARYRLTGGRAVACGGLVFWLADVASCAASAAAMVTSRTALDRYAVLQLIGLALITVQGGMLGMLCGGLTPAVIDRRFGQQRFRLEGAAGCLTDGRIGDGTPRDG
jgi:hypothetical protein